MFDPGGSAPPNPPGVASSTSTCSTTPSGVVSFWPGVCSAKNASTSSWLLRWIRLLTIRRSSSRPIATPPAASAATPASRPSPEAIAAAPGHQLSPVACRNRRGTREPIRVTIS